MNMISALRRFTKMYVAEEKAVVEDIDVTVHVLVHAL